MGKTQDRSSSQLLLGWGERESTWKVKPSRGVLDVQEGAKLVFGLLLQVQIEVLQKRQKEKATMLNAVKKYQKGETMDLEKVGGVGTVGQERTEGAVHAGCY